MPRVREQLALRGAFTAIALGAGVVGVWWFTHGLVEVGGLLFFGALITVPLAPYLLVVRTRQGSLWTGVTLIGMVVLVQVWVNYAWESGSSTAPLIYFWIPLVGPVIVAIGAVLERIDRR